MKLLTVVIPSYNAEKWIKNCLDSLLIGLDEKIEVIVVNDGSNDLTSKYAHEYEQKYSFIKVIDKENGGHGSGINSGLKEANGLYFKVLDSDDKLDKEGLYNLINYIEKHIKDNNFPDVYLADYISVYEPTNEQNVISIKKYFKKINEVITPNDIKKFNLTSFFFIHEFIVRTDLLKETNLNLIEKTFYEDNQFVYHVLINAKTYCYLDKPIYLYSVGRAAQSVSLQSMMKNYSHQLRVLSSTYNMISYSDMKKLDKGHKRVIEEMFFTISYLSYFYVYIGKGKQRRKEFKDIWCKFKKENRGLYNKINFRTDYFFFRLVPPIMRRKACEWVYQSTAKKKGWTF